MKEVVQVNIWQSDHNGKWYVCALVKVEALKMLLHREVNTFPTFEAAIGFATSTYEGGKGL